MDELYYEGREFKQVDLGKKRNSVGIFKAYYYNFPETSQKRLLVSSKCAIENKNMTYDMVECNLKLVFL